MVQHSHGQQSAAANLRCQAFQPRRRRPELASCADYANTAMLLAVLDLPEEAAPVKHTHTHFCEMKWTVLDTQQWGPVHCDH